MPFCSVQWELKEGFSIHTCTCALLEWMLEKAHEYVGAD